MPDQSQARPLYLCGRCHEGSPTWVRVFPDGTLEVVCAMCGQPLWRVQLTHEQHEQLATTLLP